MRAFRYVVLGGGQGPDEDVEERASHAAGDQKAAGIVDRFVRVRLAVTLTSLQPPRRLSTTEIVG